MINFSEIVANRISRKPTFINFIRILALFVAAFGILCNIAGYELGNLWAFSDLGNILIVYFNIPLVFLGSNYVFKATKHFKEHSGEAFSSDITGRNDLSVWNK